MVCLSGIVVLLPKAASVTGKCCSLHDSRLWLKSKLRALFNANFSGHVKKGQSEYEKVVTKFDSNEINFSITNDGKPTNLGILKTLE